MEGDGQGHGSFRPRALPAPTHRVGAPMRDGARLDTCIWLPDGAAPAPAILVRTPYSRSVNAASEGPLVRLLEAGYAVVLQQIRGVGRSEGRFSFFAPHERSDGYDTVEWIAAQPWCSGAVGMDGHSYCAMTQILAAVARPPHLACIAPAVASLDFFQEPPYVGGAFSRMHTLVWAKALQHADMLDAEDGAFAMDGFLTNPALLHRWTSRPLAAAADGELTGDARAHYIDALAHPTLDDWWRARMLGPEDFAALDLPMLVVSGNFDPSVGALTLWRGVEAHAARPENRHLLMGPWDHNAAFIGGRRHHAHYDLGEDALLDVVGARLAFFDHHLKGEGPGPILPGRCSVFITGANTWRGFDRFPPPDAGALALALDSDGRANSSRGDGRLTTAPHREGAAPDHFIDDPEWPFVDALGFARGPAFFLDLRERERSFDTLVYCTGPLDAPVTILGEATVELTVASDAPDADICVWLAEHMADGGSKLLGFGQLRLRYHAGFDAERFLTPGVPVRISIPVTYVAHRVPRGSSLRLLIGGSNFPLLDPNPHVAGPIADATDVRTAVQTVFHDPARPSRLVLPLAP